MKKIAILLALLISISSAEPIAAKTKVKHRKGYVHKCPKARKVKLTKYY